MSTKKIIIVVVIILMAAGALYSFVLAPSNVTKGSINVDFGSFTVGNQQPSMLFDRLKSYSHTQLYQLQEKYQKTAWLVTDYACIGLTSTGITAAQRQSYKQYLTNFAIARTRLMLLLDQGYSNFERNRTEIDNQISTLNVTSMFMGEIITLIGRNRPDCMSTDLRQSAFTELYDDRQAGGRQYLQTVNLAKATLDQLIGRSR